MRHIHPEEHAMNHEAIILTRDDYYKLKGLIETFKRTRKMSQPHYKRLEEELRTARVLEDRHIPDGIVTIGSRIRYTDTASGISSEAVIVFPAQVKEHEHNISVISPMGLALMGEREDTEVVYTAPGGEYTVHIDRVSHG
jgi:regulator of nucleoside diphosphate kinase